MSSRKDILRSKRRFLIDTSFLLPAMGIETEEEVIEAIKHFYKAEIYYLEVSILEAMWKVIKVVPSDKIERVRRGLESIMETYKQIVAPPEAYIDAYKLYYEGHKDYIDNLLYASSLRLNLPLLTIDKEFIAFLKKKGYPVDNIVTPERI